jgi:hypothetical protein
MPFRSPANPVAVGAGGTEQVVFRRRKKGWYAYFCGWHAHCVDAKNLDFGCDVDFPRGGAVEPGTANPDTVCRLGERGCRRRRIGHRYQQHDDNGQHQRPRRDAASRS